MAKKDYTGLTSNILELVGGKENINSVFHYLPLHLSNMGRRFGGKEGDCPVTESVSDRLIRLPFYNDLSEADQARVVSAIAELLPVDYEVPVK